MLLAGEKSLRLRSWDGAGATASMLCIAHCIGTPLLAASLPVLAATERVTHMGLAVLLVSIGAVAFIPGLRRHGKGHVPLLGAAGLVLISYAAFAPEGLLSEAVEVALPIAGGATLIYAHLMNASFCHCCPICAGKSASAWESGA